MFVDKIQDECDRQLTIPALANLVLLHPGLDYAARLIAVSLDGGGLYDEFKELRRDMFDISLTDLKEGKFHLGDIGLRKETKL